MPTTFITHVEAASTLAVVVASHEPLLFLSTDQTVIAASASFCRAFEVDPATVPGRHLSELGGGEWGIPGLASLLSATASGIATIEGYDIDLVRPDQRTRQLVVSAQILDDGVKDHIRLLLAITDVTETRAAARQKDDLVREKAMLLLEVQHRVANSLQIIASVLMQSARRVQSEEVRTHLHSAHGRVMSVASVQRLLSIAGGGQVSLQAYLAQLCESLGVSMIADKNRVSISVNVDDSTVEAEVSLSLGLIVTELVINALKHAFPDQKTGTIAVEYWSEGSDWTLSVTDDGDGIPTGAAAPKAGLGSSIIEALAKNLDAELTFSDAQPGAAVTIRHRAGDLAQARLLPVSAEPTRP